MTKRKYRILVVDDSRTILKSIEHSLSTTPYETITCDNPLKAYEKIENEHFDIVISDIMMPEMDGLSLLRKIKNFNGTIQVIMITGFITINNTLNAFRYGANDIFFKPLKDMRALTTAVDEASRKLDRINELLQIVSEEKEKGHGYDGTFPTCSPPG